MTAQHQWLPVTQQQIDEYHALLAMKNAEIRRLTTIADQALKRADGRALAVVDTETTRAEIAGLEAQLGAAQAELARARAARVDGRHVAIAELSRILHAATGRTETVSDAWRAGRDHVLAPIRARLAELDAAPQPDPRRRGAESAEGAEDA